MIPNRFDFCVLNLDRPEDLFCGLQRIIYEYAELRDSGLIVSLRPDLLGFRQALVWHYLLLEEDGGVTALDTGYGPAGWRIRRWFRQNSRNADQLKSVLLTHAHVDHAGCAAKLRRWSNAAIHLHPEDANLLRGRHRQPGISRIGEWTERFLRPVVGFGRFDGFEPLFDGQELPNWGGLRVVHLPGHTPGHVGFYSASKKILFAGDAILSRGRRCFFPARIFNSDHPAVRESILRVADLDVDWVYPSHHRGLEHNLMLDIRKFAEKRRSQPLDAG